MIPEIPAIGSINLVALATAMAVIIGLVNGIALWDVSYPRPGLPPRITPFAKYVFAMIFGILFGVLGWFDLTIPLGIVAALASSGLYKLTQN